VAEEREEKIPLHCYNKRFFCPLYVEQLEEPRGVQREAAEVCQQEAEDVERNHALRNHAVPTTSPSPEDSAAAAETEPSEAHEQEDYPTTLGNHAVPTTSSSPADSATAAETIPPEQEESTTPLPMDIASAYQSIPQGCANIVLSNLFAHNGDDESIDLFARFLALEVYFFEGLKPLVKKEKLHSV